MNQETSFVKSIFGRLAGNYDLLNRILSFRRDTSWRQFAVRKLLARRGSLFLDVAAGTCEAALELVRADPAARVVAIDFTFSMMARGKVKIARASQTRRVYQALGDGLCLPFSEATFDGAIVAFGIRNILDREGALREMARVLTPGGIVVVLEFAVPNWRWLQPLYFLYLSRILPRLGGVLSGNRKAYQYLSDSIQEFPPPDMFQRTIEAAGFVEVAYWPLTFGIVGVYEGRCEGKVFS